MPAAARILAHDATTRRARSTSIAPVAARHLLSPSQIVASPETQLSYRVERLLGQGGYGQVYLVRRLGRSSAVPAILCLKVSPHIDGWLREAYFGQLLAEHPRAIRVFDRFPIAATGG